VEEELAKERDYTRHLIESSPDFLVTLDKDGGVRDMNEAFEKIVGKSREDLTGASIYEYLPKEETEKAIAEISEKGKVRNIELTLNIPGKETLLCNFSGTVFSTSEGELGIYATGRDITELKRAEETLQKAHDELELRVKERTTELERSNEQLRTEISDREQAEQKVKNRELSALHRLFKQGKCYLLVEEKPDTCFKLFNKLIEYGFKGMLISRIHPSQIQEEYKVKDLPTIWLTQVREENCIEPTNITQLSIAVKGFAEKGAEGVILLEGLEYLIVQNGFEVVLRFVQTMADIVMISKCRLIISFDAQTLGEVELHRLERELNVTNANEIKVLILD
jgi:PAS domain S-box-containing protein